MDFSLALFYVSSRLRIPASNPPFPPFLKRGIMSSPFEKGGLRGIFISNLTSNFFRLASSYYSLFTIHYSLSSNIFLNYLLCYRRSGTAAVSAVLYEHRNGYLWFIYRCECGKPCVVIQPGIAAACLPANLQYQSDNFLLPLRYRRVHSQHPVRHS